MTATPNNGHRPDFSDMACLRAAIAATLVGGFLIGAFSRLAFFGAHVGILGLSTFGPAIILGCLIVMAMVVVGFLVMGAYRGDHTTWKAAAIIGARTAAIGLAIPLFFVLLQVVGTLLLQGAGALPGALSALETLLVVGVPVLCIGALTGLAARAAAGRPTLLPASAEAPSPAAPAAAS